MLLFYETLKTLDFWFEIGDCTEIVCTLTGIWGLGSVRFSAVVFNTTKKHIITTDYRSRYQHTCLSVINRH